jgi:hypothetical protein
MKFLTIAPKTLFCILMVIGCFISSCSKNDLLKEVPGGFLSPENSFTTKAGFESATADLYRLGRGLRTVERFTGEGDKINSALYASGTDLGWYWDKKLNFGNYTLINPTNALATNLWTLLFKLLQSSNVIISRLEHAPLSDADKNSIEAQARWFRAYAYRFLVYLFGDVPKITSEITGPKFDFVRTPKKEILAFMIEDLEFASQHLPVTNPGDGHLSKAAADDILAETYISVGDYDSAVAAASRVIDDGQYRLMTQRFGRLSNKPGDVFWDLFRLGNQDRSTGNTEAILVWQMDYGTPGGEATYSIERSWGPYLEQLKDADGKKAILPQDSLGRGVGFIMPSPYLSTEIWQNDDGDIRNSAYNMQRVFYNNNPASKEFGKPIPPPPTPNRNYYVWLKKGSCPYGHPQGYDTNGRLYTDIYAIRLAETYLLRAEAYLDNGEKIKAAADINVVRARAHAASILPAQVDINYILDERARELAGEAPRRLTLARLGLLYKRVKQYNPVSAPTIQPFNNLLPIPQNTIDANSEAPFPQNTGY